MYFGKESSALICNKCCGFKTGNYQGENSTKFELFENCIGFNNDFTQYTHTLRRQQATEQN